MEYILPALSYSDNVNVCINLFLRAILRGVCYLLEDFQSDLKLARQQLDLKQLSSDIKHSQPVFFWFQIVIPPVKTKF